MTRLNFDLLHYSHNVTKSKFASSGQVMSLIMNNPVSEKTRGHTAGRSDTSSKKDIIRVIKIPAFFFERNAGDKRITIDESRCLSAKTARRISDESKVKYVIACALEILRDADDDHECQT